MTYLPDNTFKMILDFCGETTETKQRRLWDSISIERKYYKKGDSYDRYGYNWADSPPNIYYVGLSTVPSPQIKGTYYCDKGDIRCDCVPIWKLDH